MVPSSNDTDTSNITSTWMEALMVIYNTHSDEEVIVTTFKDKLVLRIASDRFSNV